MKKWLVFFILVSAFTYLEANSSLSDSNLSPSTPETRIELKSPSGSFFVYQPNLEQIERTAPIAQAIFVEAFSSTYKEYHSKSNSSESVEEWLKIKGDISLEEWLSSVFNEEYQECLAGTKKFIYLCDANGNLIGWLSHSPVDANGDVYLAQSSIEANFRNQKIATLACSEVLTDLNIKTLFPGIKELKLIVRKINTYARSLYAKAGFIMDETIDPSVYGDSYDDRYVGYRLPIEE